MRPFDYLRIARRRWWILALGALVGLLLAYVTQPTEVERLQASAPSVSFRATHLLIADPTSTGHLASAVGYDRLALLTVSGPVRDAALARLGAKGWPTIIKRSTTATSTADGNSVQRQQATAADPQLPKFRSGRGSITIYGKQGIISVAPVPDPATGALAITATGGKSSAPEAANVFADELVKYLDKLGELRYAGHLAQLQNQLTLAQETMTELDGRILAASGNPVLQSQLSVYRSDQVTKSESASQEMRALQQGGPEKSDLQTLDRASTEREVVITAPGGSTMSSDQRLLVGFGIGFLFGLALLVMMELLGARVRDVAGTEGAARMPVIAEIPVVKMSRDERFVVATAAAPASLTAEAYRSLRTSLLAMWQRHPRNVAEPDGAPVPSSTPRGRPLRTLLITSPGPAEGKSISVVNLAAAFAETGMTVVVIDADFRRPTQYRYLDRPRDPNLGDLDIACSAQDLEAVLQDTDVPGVRLAASAPSKADPGHAIAVAKSAASVATELADIVLIDSPPLLLANDASDIALDVDASILLARAGWTRRSGIVASADLMRRLEAPVIGIVIVGAEHGVRSGYYGYYGYYGYGYGYAHPGEVSVVSRLLPWKQGRKAQTSASASRSGPRAPAGPTGEERIPRSAHPDDDEPWV